MANIKSAKKRALQNEKRKLVNATRRSSIKTLTKSVLDAIKQGKEIVTVKEMFKGVESKLSRAKGKGLLHRNNAARKTSRLAKRVATYAKSNTQAQ
jgi:small subunit ribosomal protein S20